MRGRGWLWVLVAASLLSLPVLTLGLVNDDFIHRLALSAGSEKYDRDALKGALRVRYEPGPMGL